MAFSGMKKLEELYRKKIAKRIDEIAAHLWTWRTPIKDIAVAETMKHLPLAEATRLTYKPVTEGFRWGKPWSTAWFRLRFTIPGEFRGKRVSMLFEPEGECIIFRDGLPVQGLDANRSDYVITENARGGEQLELCVEAGVPSLMQAGQQRTLQQACLAVTPPELWNTWFDLHTLHEIISPRIHRAERPMAGLSSESPRGAKLLYELNKAVDMFDFQDTSYDSLVTSATRISKALKPLYACRADASAPTVAAIGHAHIDLAWMWPLAETMRKCGRSFSNVLSLMDRYPQFQFAQSQPVLYEYTKERYPSLFKRIREKIRQGQWHPAGCTWVEMDCNLAGAESLVRQVLFGTRYFKEEFDYQTHCLWLPDVFGYSAALPQILKRSGIDNFLTQKICWNEFTTFPHHTFIWEGIDGSRVLSHFLPSDDYTDPMLPTGLRHAVERYSQKDRSDIHACLFGYGDGGGGPTKQMLERLARMDNLEGVPRTRPMSPGEFFRRLAKESCDLPMWVGELYLEYHRGTLTTLAACKTANRKGELLLREAEMLASLELAQGHSYPQETFNDAWKKLLLNQFHDIIPGTSIGRVYDDAAKDYAEVHSVIRKAKDGATKRLARSVDTQGKGQAVVLFNQLGWERNDVAAVDGIKLPTDQQYVAVTPEGQEAPVQIGSDDKVRFCVDLPSIGHNVVHLRPGHCDAANEMRAADNLLENDLLRVKFDAEGLIKSIYDKQAQREVLEAGKRGNELILFEDKPLRYDAWNIDIFYEDKPLQRNGTLLEMKLIETGPVRSVLRIRRQISKSTLTQDIVLTAGSNRLDFVTTVEWGDEKDVLLKAAFPVAVRSPHARYEIQFGNLQRPTHGNTPQDFAQFEVGAHKWADLSESSYGVALLNDCKYGYDIRDNVMRLSLLRAPKHPYPDADINQTHQFTYALLPHKGDFTNGVVREAYQLNAPLVTKAAAASRGNLPARQSSIAVSGENIVIETVKKCEDSGDIIVRLYEAHGARGQRTLSTNLPVQRAVLTNLMEKEEKELRIRNNAVKLTFGPYQIHTVKLCLNN